MPKQQLRHRDPFTHSRIVSMYRKGHRQHEIVKAVGLPKHVVRTALVHEGLVPQRQNWTPEQLRIQEIVSRHNLTPEKLEACIRRDQAGFTAPTSQETHELTSDNTSWVLLWRLFYTKLAEFMRLRSTKGQLYDQ